MPRKKKKEPKLLNFSYDELNVSVDAFVNEFIASIVYEYKIPKKKLDEIYTRLVNRWNNGATGEKV